MKEEEPYDYTPQEDNSPQAGDDFGSLQSYDDEDTSLQSQLNDIAVSGELTNAQIQQLDDDDRRLQGELASLKGDIDQLCALYAELPVPKTIGKTAQEVANEYLDEKNLTAQQAGAILLKALKCSALRANVATALIDFGGRLVIKLKERRKLLLQREHLSHQMIEKGNQALEIGGKRIENAQERFAAMGQEFVNRHEQRQHDYENMLNNVDDESKRQWEEIRRTVDFDSVESPCENDIDDLTDGFDNI